MKPRNEMALDFDQSDAPWHDDVEWWRQQDDDLQQQELADLEAQAQIFDYRLNGYE